MPETKIFDYSNGRLSLSFDCGVWPADDVVIEAGHEPNGYFWEGVATLVAPEVVERLELDSEGDMFNAFGALSDLEALRGEIEAVLRDPEAARGIIERAEAEGFEFDD